MDDDILNELLNSLREEGYCIDNLSDEDKLKLKSTILDNNIQPNYSKLNIKIHKSNFKNDKFNDIRLDRDLFKKLNLKEGETVRVFSKVTSQLARVLKDDIYYQQLCEVGMSKEFIKKLSVKERDIVRIIREY